jgi:hypothetical protein
VDAVCIHVGDRTDSGRIDNMVLVFLPVESFTLRIYLQ